ncbi:hypothetical protein [uncultured Rhodoblastus sp.]|uniref:hypothetical protein n=1 Tax=uncultured Rhodoblastus sp. TaxID=543037 RepID=UPI0025D97E8D|nr:hypothetical protein [uncultured Rhodoblastus sp.]
MTRILRLCRRIELLARFGQGHSPLEIGVSLLRSRRQFCLRALEPVHLIVEMGDERRQLRHAFKKRGFRPQCLDTILRAWRRFLHGRNLGSKRIDLLTRLGVDHADFRHASRALRFDGRLRHHLFRQISVRFLRNRRRRSSFLYPIIDARRLILGRLWTGALRRRRIVPLSERQYFLQRIAAFRRELRRRTDLGLGHGRQRRRRRQQRLRRHSLLRDHGLFRARGPQRHSRHDNRDRPGRNAAKQHALIDLPFAAGLGVALALDRSVAAFFFRRPFDRAVIDRFRRLFILTVNAGDFSFRLRRFPPSERAAKVRQHAFENIGRATIFLFAALILGERDFRRTLARKAERRVAIDWNSMVAILSVEALADIPMHIHNKLHR